MAFVNQSGPCVLDHSWQMNIGPDVDEQCAIHNGHDVPAISFAKENFVTVKALSAVAHVELLARGGPIEVEWKNDGCHGSFDGKAPQAIGDVEGAAPFGVVKLKFDGGVEAEGESGNREDAFRSCECWRLSSAFVGRKRWSRCAGEFGEVGLGEPRQPTGVLDELTRHAVECIRSDTR